MWWEGLSQAKCSRELSPNPFGQALLWEAFFVDGLGLAMQYSADITGFYWFTGRLASVCGWCQVLSHVVLQTGDRSGCLPILLSAWDRNLEPRRLKRWWDDILGLVSSWFSLRMMSYVLCECMGMMEGHFTLGPWMHEAAMEHEVFGSHCWTRRWWSSSTEISARYVVIDCGCWYLVLYRIAQLSWCTLTNSFASGGSARSCLPLPGCKGDQPVDPTRRCVVVASIFVHAAVQCNVYCTCRYNCYMVYCMAYLICLITSCHLSGASAKDVFTLLVSHQASSSTWTSQTWCSNALNWTLKDFPLAILSIQDNLTRPTTFSITLMIKVEHIFYVNQ